jgi:serine/threonine protein kinase/tetratricopeptide (TPR) repeat protein
LGRGAFGRVYLATQAELGDRPVALKVSKALGDEPKNLARLQHTHIMPIHSVHDDPETGLRLMCMPYVGGANLSQVLETAGARVVAQATGRSLIEALDQVGAFAESLAPASHVLSRSRLASRRRSTVPASRPFTAGLAYAATRDAGSPSMVRSLWGRYLARTPWWNELAGTELDRDHDAAEPARRYLRTATYVQAVVWIAARLAEALEHAHQRGLLHRDLKPSNILIAADGTPMLLDFNLSAEIRSTSPADEAKAMIGGTLPYMAPEHLDAFNPEGTTPPEAVDERSDIYALGLILYEMLAGRHPFPDPKADGPMTAVLNALTADRLRGAPSVRRYNAQVPWSLESVLRLCLDPRPGRRYQSASELAEDLRLSLDDLPLKHAPELSLRERAAKWARRHPRLCSVSSVGVLTLVVAIGLGSAVWSLLAFKEASTARFRHAAFQRVFNECQLLLNTSSGPSEHLERGVAKAGAALDVYQVQHAGDWRAGPLVRGLPKSERESLLEEMSELVQLRARAIVYLAARRRSPDELRTANQRALSWVVRAERFDPHPTAALYEDRAQYEEALGDAAGARRDRARAAGIALTSARDGYLRGTSLLARGRPDAAETLLLKTTALEPGRFWAWFVLGLCHLEQGRNAEAAGDFAVCTTLYPEFAWPHLNRGLALTRAGRPSEARASYDRALQANPNFLEALVNRGLCALEMRDSAQAERDLGRAIELGHRDPSILAARAEALSRLGRRRLAEREFDDALRKRPDDPALLVARGFFHLKTNTTQAWADFGRALERDPKNVRARLGQAHLLRASDRAAAVAVLDEALTIDPGFLDALALRALLRGRSADPRAENDIDALVQVPTAHRLYNAACALAILSRTTRAARYQTRAVHLLGRALDAGFPRAEAMSDPDLAPLKERPDYRTLFQP